MCYASGCGASAGWRSISPQSRAAVKPRRTRAARPPRINRRCTMRVFTLDNTFGYNPGRADFPFSLADKAAIVQELDRLGIDYVEAGCPGAGNSAYKYF